MSTIKVTKENFNQILSSKTPVLMDFWAPWCGPCRMVGPVLEEISAEFGDKAVIGKVNVDEQSELAARFNVMSIPTLILFKDGKPASTLVGAHPKQNILKLLNV